MYVFLCACECVCLGLYTAAFKTTITCAGPQLCSTAKTEYRKQDGGRVRTRGMETKKEREIERKDCLSMTEGGEKWTLCVH